MNTRRLAVLVLSGTVVLAAPVLSTVVAAVDGEERKPAVAVPELVEPIASARDPAMQQTLILLEKSAATYTQKRECFACHHQTLPAVTLAMARQRGYDVDGKAMAAQADFTLKYFSERSDRLKKGDGVPGGPFSAGYALVGLHAAGRQPDATTAAIVAYLFQTQEKNGQWRIRTHRPPLEDSHFTATALAVRGIQLLAAKDQAEEAARRVGDARKWLMESLDEASQDGGDRAVPQQLAKPQTGKPAGTKQALSNEDRTYRLLGLHWCRADKAAIAKAAADLRVQQRSDGGWSQTADMASDAYATGQALVALHEASGAFVTAGLSRDRAACRRGLE